MKTLILTITLLLGLLAAAPPAKADYLGTTPRATGYAIEIAVPTQDTQLAITILNIDKRFKIASVEPLVFVGNVATGSRAVPTSISRIVMQIDGVRGDATGAVVKITAGTNKYEIPLSDSDPEASVTLDFN